MEIPTLKKSSKKPKKDAVVGCVDLKTDHSFSDFSDLASIIKSVLVCNDKDVLIGFYKNIAGKPIDLRIEAENAGVDRIKEYDLGFLRNMVFLVTAIGYCKAMHDDFLCNNKISDVDNYMSWIENLEYGNDGPVFDRNGEFLIAKTSRAPVRSGPVDVPSKRKTKKEPDEISLELDNCGKDYDEMIKTAASYGLPKETGEKYRHFVDSGRLGLARMNLENRLRTLLKKKTKKK